MNTANITPTSHRPAMLIAMLLFAVCCMSAQYSIQSFTGKVQVKHAGKVVPASISMRISGADLIIIGENSSVQILDKRSSQLFTCSEPGQIGVISLIHNARMSAKSNAGAVHRKISMGRSSSAEGRMYVEKGKITMALEEYDPDGEAFAIDTKILARYVLPALLAADSTVLPTFPTEIAHTGANTDEMMFSIDNTADQPLYINIIKTERDADGQKPVQLKISELGQPVGCYVLLPGQSIMRSQRNPRDTNATHMLIAAHYYFSIDELLDRLNNDLTEPPVDNEPLPILPIYIQKL